MKWSRLLAMNRSNCSGVLGVALVLVHLRVQLVELVDVPHRSLLLAQQAPHVPRELHVVHVLDPDAPALALLDLEPGRHALLEQVVRLEVVALALGAEPGVRYRGLELRVAPVPVAVPVELDAAR
jgi:hypothetical protein